MDGAVVESVSVPTAIGFELQNERPAVVVARFDSFAVISLGRTGQQWRGYANHVRVDAGDGGLRAETVFDLLQVAAVQDSALSANVWGRIGDETADTFGEALAKTTGVAAGWEIVPSARPASDKLQGHGFRFAAVPVRRGDIVDVSTLTWNGILSAVVGADSVAAIVVSSPRVGAKANTTLLIPILRQDQAVDLGVTGPSIVLTESAGERRGSISSDAGAELIVAVPLMTRACRQKRAITLVGQVTDGLAVLGASLTSVFDLA